MNDRTNSSYRDDGIFLSPERKKGNKMTRTIREIRENNNGKIYVFCKDSETEKKFLIDAEKEGYMFGKIKPTDSHQANIIAVEDDMQLAHVSTAGRIAFKQGEDLTRIDYAKYISGDSDYNYTDE